MLMLCTALYCTVRAVVLYLIVVRRHERVKPRTEIIEKCDLSGFNDCVPHTLREVLLPEIHERAEGRVRLIHDKSRL